MTPLQTGVRVWIAAGHTDMRLRSGALGAEMDRIASCFSSLG
jgi:hypothetical protein